MDGKHELPTKFDVASGVPSRYYGYSVGRWEGDNTLVINTVGVNDVTWLDKAGHPHSVEAKVDATRERTTITCSLSSVDDPKIFTKPSSSR